MSRGGSPQALRSIPMELGKIRTAAIEVVGQVAARERGEGLTFTCSVCRRTPLFRPDVCKGCVQKEADGRREDDALDRARVPKRYRWARLTLRPFRPPWLASPVVPDADIERAASSHAALIVIRGESGSGKTSLACALARRAIDKGRSTVFVEADRIAPDAEDQGLASALFARASQESCVILDDIGQDIGGAPAGGGLAAYRSGRVRRLVRALVNGMTGNGPPERRLILTLGLDDEQTAAGYDDGFLRRIREDTPDALLLDLKPQRPHERR